MEFVVKLVNKPILIDRNGINYYSNKVLKYSFTIKRNEILIYSRQSYESIFRAIQREKCEAFYIKKGYSYEDAHKIALEFECTGLEFPEELYQLIKKV